MRNKLKEVKVMVKKLLFFCMVLALMSLSASAEQSTKDEGNKKFPEKTTEIIVLKPSARAMIGALSKMDDLKIFASKIKDTKTSAYGFSSGITKEKGSFKLGILMADLEVTLRSGDKGKTLDAIKSLIQGLEKLGAPESLLIAAINLNAAVQSGIDLKSINKASIPLIKPFIEEFIQKEGKMTYLRFGEWVETTKLTTEGANQQTALTFIKDMNLAETFLKEFKEDQMPKGVFTSLNAIAQLNSTLAI
jgi:hypothetical protein